MKPVYNIFKITKKKPIFVPQDGIQLVAPFKNEQHNL